MPEQVHFRALLFDTHTHPVHPFFLQMTIQFPFEKNNTVFEDDNNALDYDDRQHIGMHFPTGIGTEHCIKKLLCSLTRTQEKHASKIGRASCRESVGQYV